MIVQVDFINQRMTTEEQKAKKKVLLGVFIFLITLISTICLSLTILEVVYISLEEYKS